MIRSTNRKQILEENILSFLFLLFAILYKNKEKTNSNMGKYNSTRVAVSKKYMWGLGTTLASLAHKWDVSYLQKGRRESINQKWERGWFMCISIDCELQCGLYSKREQKQVNLALKYTIKMCFLNYILHSGAQLTGHHFSLCWILWTGLISPIFSEKSIHYKTSI